MDLIQLKKKVQEKDNSRNKLLGQKSMLVDNLKKLGFKTLGEAKKESHKIKNKLKKMDSHYKEGVEKFKKDFGHLLQ